MDDTRSLASDWATPPATGADTIPMTNSGGAADMSCSAGGNDIYQPKFERKQRTNSVALSRQANSCNRWVEMSCDPQCSAGGIRAYVI